MEGKLLYTCWALGRIARPEKVRSKGADAAMSRVCHFTGKKTRSGRQIARRGKAKYLGGVGRKTTGSTKRTFKANIQRVRAIIDGKVCRIRVSAKAIRMGLLEKPRARDWKASQQAITVVPEST